MNKIYLVLFLLLPLLSKAQDWSNKGTLDWPIYQKDLIDTCDVIPLGVDFGACSMALGWALTDSGCVVLSGCGWIGSDGNDYTSSFFSSANDCNNACVQDTVIMLKCIDTNLIDLQVFCPGVIDPVCGCDSVTYQNECVAIYYHGVSSFYQGPCVSNGMQVSDNTTITVFPNPSKGVFCLENLPANATIICTDLLGKSVYQITTSEKSIDIELGNLPKGCYLLKVNGNLLEKLLIE